MMAFVQMDAVNSCLIRARGLMYSRLASVFFFFFFSGVAMWFLPVVSMVYAIGKCVVAFGVRHLGNLEANGFWLMAALNRQTFCPSPQHFIRISALMRHGDTHKMFYLTFWPVKFGLGKGSSATFYHPTNTPIHSSIPWLGFPRSIVWVKCVCLLFPHPYFWLCLRPNLRCQLIFDAADTYPQNRRQTKQQNMKQQNIAAINN